MARMRPLDAVVLGPVAVLAGPAPGQAEFLAALVPRLRTVRRFGRWARRAPLDVGPPNASTGTGPCGGAG